MVCVFLFDSRKWQFTCLYTFSKLNIDSFAVYKTMYFCNSWYCNKEFWILLKRGSLIKIFRKVTTLWTKGCPFSAIHQGGSDSVSPKSMKMPCHCHKTQLARKTGLLDWKWKMRASHIHFWSLVNTQTVFCRVRWREYFYRN